MAGVENQIYSSHSCFSLPILRSRELLAGSAVAATLAGTAISRLGQFAIGANAGLRHGAPEKAIAGAGDCGIGRGPDVLALPMQRGAQPPTFSIESFRYVAHAAPPAACDPAAARMARFTATRARWILWALWPRLFAFATAACVTALP